MIIAHPLGLQAEPLDADSDSDGGDVKRLRVLPLPVGPQVVLVVGGEADMSNARALRARLLEATVAGSPPVVVDLVDLEFCDLFGLDAMREAAAIAETAGVGMTFRGMSRRLIWLDGTFPFRMPGQRHSA